MMLSKLPRVTVKLKQSRNGIFKMGKLQKKKKKRI